VIFFEENFFRFSDDASLPATDPAVWIHRQKQSTRAAVFRLLESGVPFRQVIYSPDPAQLHADFCSFFREVEAAGGVVMAGGRLLVIKRFGKIDLPKGHLEAGESPEAGAMREVEEECGIGGLQVTGSLPDTRHLYFREGRWCLKHTCWYLMSCSPDQEPAPQTEEGIEAAYWVSPEQFSALSGQAHPSLQPVFRNVLDRLAACNT
jgi:8-oxo-dGTP pyrophosphatase MutT (NUDIX family)